MQRSTAGRVAVIGGGIGGLTAAALLAARGVEVDVYERAAAPGGRGRTDTLGDRQVNLGPHALYAAGAADRVLRRLGITPAGAVAPPGGKVLRGGALHALPATLGSALSTTALGLADLASVGRHLLPGGDPAGTVTDWLAGAPPAAADLLRGLVRVSSYCEAPDLQSAAAAVRQLRLALRGVRYLDGGWQRIVLALQAAPGVRVHTGVDVRQLPEDVDAVVIAGPPALARRLGCAVPPLTAVRAACLDLALDRLPVPEHRFVLGLDEPLYLSEHGGVAALGGPVLHVARYLAPGEPGAAARPRLEALLDQAQPGWRSVVRAERFLPELIVTHRVDRPGERVEGAQQVGGRPVHLVGDWVGEEGMLLDRSMASAEAAADALLVGARRAA
jgi:hypothetical protein